MASTVLPNGIIIPEKYSRDWYNDLYHNWQELDNLLAGGGANDGTLTIQKNSSTVGTFSANQATDETINITVPDVNDATLTIQQNGTTVDTFTANASSNVTANITVPTKTSDLTNDSGFITSDNTKIPLAGSNAISGSLIPATDNEYDLGDSTYGFKDIYTNKLYLKGSTIFTLVDDSFICLGGATAQANGANLTLNGKNRSTSTGEFKLEARDGINTSGLTGYPDGTLTWAGTFILPTSNGTCKLGSAGSRWKEIWCTQSSINSSSDKRLKQQIDSIDDKLLNAWENVEPAQYKFNDAVEIKGKNARYHVGYVAQDIQSALEKSGVNASDYGFFLYDSWEEQTEISHEETYTEEIETKSGEKQTVTKTRKVIDTPYKAKGDSYGLRYIECLVVECKYLRRCIKRLTARIEELEKGNNTK